VLPPERGRLGIFLLNCMVKSDSGAARLLFCTDHKIIQFVCNTHNGLVEKGAGGVSVSHSLRARCRKDFDAIGRRQLEGRTRPQQRCNLSRRCAAMERRIRAGLVDNRISSRTNALEATQGSGGKNYR
jgi:hypothetical protein